MSKITERSCHEATYWNTWEFFSKLCLDHYPPVQTALKHRSKQNNPDYRSTQWLIPVTLSESPNWRLQIACFGFSYWFTITRDKKYSTSLPNPNKTVLFDTFQLSKWFKMSFLSVTECLNSTCDAAKESSELWCSSRKMFGHNLDEKSCTDEEVNKRPSSAVK